MSPGTWSFETGARTIWQEARGETDAGRQAVAHVLVNRLRTGRFGHTLAAICMEREQFSGWNDSDPNRMEAAELSDSDPMLDKCRQALAVAQSEPDPTGGATHYYARSIKPPPWAAQMTYCGEFGSQLFFKPRFS